ncbi:MAG: T9SS type A sorting domain-containing protein, partial [candidate division KSB1 bacterium]|nr:T9SS type A sorting domain-containing protein [candidate division KSB1 bacterium]
GDDDGSGLSGEYDLRMSINHGPWFDVLTRAKTFSYVYVGAHGNSFSFEAAAWDRVGNREPFTGIAETETVVDTTFEDRTAPPPPIGLNVAGANPSKWQNSPDFTVEWRQPADPSGIAMAYWKLGSPPVHERDITDSLAVEEETGKIIVHLPSEGVYPLYVWLKDGRGNANRASAASILLRYDATLPILGTPQLLIQSQLPNYVNPKKTPIVPIRIGFRELHPDSLLFWSESLGTNRISLGSAIIDTVQFNISLAEASDGLHRLFIALKDSAGNWSGKDSLTFHLDSRPPVINLMAADTLTEESRQLTLRAVVSDNDTLTVVKLLYRRGGQRRFVEKQMKKVSGALYEGEIPGSEVTVRGVEWAISAIDGVNESRYPTEAPAAGVRVRVTGGNQQGLTMPWPLPSGSEQDAYRMISLPLEPDKSSPKDIFEDDFGPYDPHVWRLFQWEPLEAIYLEYPQISAVRPGAAYWLITAKEGVTLDSGPGTSVNTVTPFVVVLKKGWNDIASPFAFPVDWRDVRWASAVDTQKVQGPHAYIGRWQYPFENTVMQPWQGYAVYSEAEDFTITIPALEAQPALAKKNPFERPNIEWSMQIIAKMNKAEDSANYLGFAKDATEKWDYGLDYVEAPAIGSYIQLYFPHSDWQLAADQYTTDFRPVGQGAVWHIEAAAQTAGEAVLIFRFFGPLKNSLSLMLADVEAGTSIDLRADSLYIFRFTDNQQIRRFSLFAGNEKFIKEHQDELPQVADTYSMLQNHPNPFNHSTIISFRIDKAAEINLAVYNLLAQKVKQIYQGPIQGGFYQFSWDARDDAGREVGTGIYILRLETPDFASTRKLVYIR